MFKTQQCGRNRINTSRSPVYLRSHYTFPHPHLIQRRGNVENSPPQPASVVHKNAFSSVSQALKTPRRNEANHPRTARRPTASNDNCYSSSEIFRTFTRIWYTSNYHNTIVGKRGQKQKKNASLTCRRRRRRPESVFANTGRFGHSRAKGWTASERNTS